MFHFFFRSHISKSLSKHHRKKKPYQTQQTKTPYFLFFFTFSLQKKKMNLQTQILSDSSSQSNSHNLNPTNYSPNIIVSQQYILSNAKAYGEIIEHKNEHYITIKLYRHKVALTLEEIEISKKIIHPIDTQKQSMYRCPLKSCQHKPLNNLYIRTHIQEHCKHYHFNDKNNYKFLYKTNEEWKESYYPPRPTILPPPTNK